MASLTEILSSGLPIKVLMQNDDILEEISIATRQFSFGFQGSQIAVMALGLANAYVLQTSAAGLYDLRESVLGGLMHNGPALFSVYSGRLGPPNGAVKNVPSAPVYLCAAAATESRAFPTLVHDPAGGGDWAARFSLDGNPQPGVDWPRHRFCYADEDLQRVAQNITFTFVDFAAADGRFAASFASVRRPEWRDFMIPVDAFLDLDTDTAAKHVPYILMVDDNNRLHRAIVEVKLIQAARRCCEMWRSLQELGGINNSHARDLLAKEKEIWQQEKAQELKALTRRLEHETGTPAPAIAVAEQQVTPVPAAAEVPGELPAAVGVEAPAAPPDEPYIETPRCTTCDECTQINNRTFAYNENKQAYIADASAGTYRDLVEAAESCQVAIIHPGKPKNPDEPGLDDLMARAETFR
ncbi:MAG: ferredoxin, partial [Alphaproteobacteria bacterium]